MREEGKNGGADREKEQRGRETVTVTETETETETKTEGDGETWLADRVARGHAWDLVTCTAPAAEPRLVFRPNNRANQSRKERRWERQRDGVRDN